MSGFLRRHWPIAMAALVVVVALGVVLMPYVTAALPRQQCPASSGELFDRYSLVVDVTLAWVYEIEMAEEGPAAKAQQLNEIKGKFEKIDPPECAVDYYWGIVSYLDFTTKVYVAKAKGGLGSELAAYYYAAWAFSARAYSSALLLHIMPPDVPDNDWQSA